MVKRKLVAAQPKDKPHYIWAVLALTALGAAVSLVIIYLRPSSDPLEVCVGVMGSLLPTIAAVLAFIKAQETHLSVNSRLDAFIRQYALVARAEGVIEGGDIERARAAAARKGGSGEK